MNVRLRVFRALAAAVLMVGLTSTMYAAPANAVVEQYVVLRGKTLQQCSWMLKAALNDGARQAHGCVRQVKSGEYWAAVYFRKYTYP